MTSGNTHLIFEGEDQVPSPVKIFGLQFNYNGNYRIQLRIKNDAGTYAFGSYITISNDWHIVEIEWQASTGPGANNGFMNMWIDNVLVSSASNVDNDTRGVDSAYLGGTDSLDAGTSGTMLFDAFDSRRQTFIGPVNSAETSITESAETYTSTATDIP